MRKAKLNFENHLDRFRTLVRVALLLTTGILANVGVTQEKGQRTFSTPEEAGQALYTAARNNDEKALLEIFGAEGKQILYSGDEAEDAESRATFLKEYEEMHRIVQEPDGAVTLYIGAKNWPIPVPLISKKNAWYFDTDSGKQEILFRRIGQNEISAIQICRQLAAAEKEFSQQNHEYAAKLFSDEGKHNGLYWEASSNQPESPIGPLVARAAADGYAVKRRGAIPYRGYFFRILTSQGKNAPRGAKSYFAGDKMTGGAAFVAFPAEYRSSGVKTFLVSTDGVVFEKDLGENTQAIAASMKRFNPDSTWGRAEDGPK
ncbi:MAG: DUF2950 domain-containing protein [Candidatus Sulfotelmatobacter sp.]